MTAADPQDFEAHRLAVFGWAWRILGHAADAEDVTQEVSLRWIQRASAEPLDNARAWLRQVTVNRALDLLRQRRPTGALQDAAARPADDAVARTELRQALAHALLELTEPQRQVLCAKVLGGETFAGIAQQMGLAIPTVKTHYLRALTKLREHLGPTWREM